MRRTYARMALTALGFTLIAACNEATVEPDVADTGVAPSSDTHGATSASTADTETGTVYTTPPDTHTDTAAASDSGSGADTVDSGSAATTDSLADSATESQPDSATESADTAGTDTGSDTAIPSDSGADTETPDTAECTPQTAATDCGAGKYCVEGVCCDAPCDGGCESCTVPGSEGTCTVLPQFTICRPKAGDCDIVERCDGTSRECPADTFLRAGITCRESTGECDPEETCSGTAPTCPDDQFAPVGTPCGDSTSTECNKADTCNAQGQCDANLVADGTPCGTSTTTYRCSTVDCGAVPQSRTEGSTCQAGSCAPVTDPQWVTLATCTANQVCETDTTSYAQCTPCDTPPADTCNADLDAVHFAAEGVCDDSTGTAQCAYPETIEDCVAPNDNCVAGTCTSFTCNPADKDVAYDWESPPDAAGWTLGTGWDFATNTPMQWNDNHLKIVTDTAITDEDGTALVSPTYEFAACTKLTVDFEFGTVNGYPVCSTPATVLLQCDNGTGWIDLWTFEDKTTGYSQGAAMESVDATACIGAQVRFRFVLRNFCGLVGGQAAVESVHVDDFSISVQ